jgi:hypothetical protein
MAQMKLDYRSLDCKTLVDLNKICHCGDQSKRRWSARVPWNSWHLWTWTSYWDICEFEMVKVEDSHFVIFSVVLVCSTDDSLNAIALWLWYDNRNII